MTKTKKIGSNVAAWPLKNLGEVSAKIGSGYTPTGGHHSYVNFGIPLIRSQNVHMNQFSREGLVHISEEQDSQMSSSRVEPDDVLLNITGASIGRVCVAPPEVCPANVNQHVCIIRSNGSWFPDFVCAYLCSPEVQNFIWKSQAGATRQALTKGMIEDFKIPLPDLPTQRRIAAELREQMSDVTQARQALEKQLTAAQALPAACLRAVFESEEAKAWQKIELGEVCQMLPARSTASAGDVEVKVITSACLTEAGFFEGGIKNSKFMSEDLDQARIRFGEILIARSNTPDLVGRVAKIDFNSEDIYSSDLTIRLFPGSQIQGDYLTAHLRFLYLVGYWKERATGASGTMKKITRGQIGALQIPLPDLPSQRRIAARLTEELTAATEIQRGLTTQQTALKQLPAALLRRVFSSEI